LLAQQNKVYKKEKNTVNEVNTEPKLDTTKEIKIPIPKETTSESNTIKTSTSESKLINKNKMTTEEKLQTKRPKMTIDVNKDYIVTLKTSEGNIAFKMYTKNKPITVNNFISLARMGFYDNINFHRVIAGFMIQGGDPLGNGTGGPAYKFEDELNEPNSNKIGTIAMANSGPNTNGSQFFINVADNDYLDSKHTVFGEIISGMDVVKKIETSPKDPTSEDPTSKLLSPVIINSVMVEEK